VATGPRLPVAVEHRVLKAACNLPPRLGRLLFGRPPEIDGQRLACDVHAMLRLAAFSGTTSFTNGLPPVEARALSREGAASGEWRPKIPMARVTAVEIPSDDGPIGARFYVPGALPGGTPPPLLVYFHGGGFVIGDLDTHDGVCRFIAAAAGLAVLSVDYRLAPEHPFPAGIEDAWTAFSWAAANAAELGVDAARIAVGGDSAGGNLAANVCLRGKAEDGPMPALQLLIYPVTDSADEPRSRQLFGEHFLLTKIDIDRFEHFYIAPSDDVNDPRVSILKAADLSGLPPAYVTTAGFDPLRDEGEAYAIRMREEGTKVALRRHPSLIHGFANQTAFSRSSRGAMLELAGALRMGLASAQPAAVTLP
jgi:acetyl esterase/lipase